MEKKYRIIVLSKETRGGSGVFLNQISKLNNKIFSLQIYLYKKDLYSTFNNKAFFINKNYPDSKGFSLNKLFVFLKNLILTYYVIVQHPSALFLACDLYSSIILLVIKKLLINKVMTISLLNIDIVNLIHSKPGRLYRYLLFKITKNLYEICDFFVCVSKGLSEKLIRFYHLGKFRVSVINNSIDPNLIRKDDSAHNRYKAYKIIKRNKNIKIVSVARLEWPKDFKTLIRAIGLVLKKNPRINLFIIGDGPQKNALKRYAESQNINQKVFFFGWQKDVYPYLESADIFVLSSISEAFPRVILEAMSVGLPVVSTDADYGPREILDNGKFGILVPIRDYKKMAFALEKLSINKSLRLKYVKLALLRIKDYNIKKMLKKYEALFKKINTM